MADTGFVDGFGHTVPGGTAQCISSLFLAPLSQVANVEKRFPLEWIVDGNRIADAFFDYAVPLMGGELPDSTDVFIPDIVKGGNQPTSHRKVAIRACLDELYSVGVEKKDVLLLFSNGLHPRATVEEARADAMRKYVGPEPNILALPQAFTTAAVQVCMKDPEQNSHSRDGASHPCCG